MPVERAGPTCSLLVQAKRVVGAVMVRLRLGERVSHRCGRAPSLILPLVGGRLGQGNEVCGERGRSEDLDAVLIGRRG